MKRYILILAVLLSSSCADYFGDPIVYVSESYGSGPIADAKIVVRDKTRASETTFVTDQNGFVVLAGLKLGHVYDIQANHQSFASSLYQGYKHDVKKRTLNLYSHKPSASLPSGECPVIKNCSWLKEDGLVSSMEKIGCGINQLERIVISVQSQKPVYQTQDNGFGIAVNLDSAPGSFDLIMPETLLKSAELQADGLFVTEAIFDVSKLKLTNGMHEVVVCVYDIENNRTEARYPFKIFNIAASGVSLMTHIPSINSYNTRTFGVNRSLFSRGESDSTAYTVISVIGVSLTDFKPLDYTAIEIYRTEDASLLNFRLVKTFIIKNLSLVYEIIDTPENAQPGKTYYYKVKAVNGSGKSRFSKVMTSFYLPSHQIQLESPTQYLKIDTEPVLSFSLKNFEEIKGYSPDAYSFGLTIKEKGFSLGDYNHSFIGIFMYFFKDDPSTGTINEIDKVFQVVEDFDSTTGKDVTKLYLMSGIKFVNGIFTIDMALAKSTLKSNGLVFNEGMTYEWSVEAAPHGPFFSKSVDGGSGQSLSFCSAYGFGSGAENGSYSFTYK